MVGFPGSGKSFISNILNKKYNYQIINQDTFKTKNKCKKIAEDFMKCNQSLVIDSTNPDYLSRSCWIELANKYKFVSSVILLTTSKELSMHNNYYRAFRMNTKPIPNVAYNIFKSKFEQPVLDEGLYRIVECHCATPKDLMYLYYLY